MAGTLDQYNTNTAVDGNGILYSSTIDKFGFTFVPQQTGVIEEIHLFLQKIGTPTGNMFVSITNVTGGSPGSTTYGQSDNVSIVAANIHTYASVITDWTEVVFPFSTKPSITSGTAYGVVWYGDYAASTANYVFGCTSTAGATNESLHKSSNTSGIWSNGTKYPLFKEYYSSGGGATAQLAKVNGIALASIAKYGGIAKASVKKVGGLTIQ